MSARRNAPVYRCPNVDCGCDMTVTRIPKREARTDDRSPVCVCGASMDRIAPPESPVLI
jgi:hypothetical protein